MIRKKKRTKNKLKSIERAHSVGCALLYGIKSIGDYLISEGRGKVDEIKLVKKEMKGMLLRR
ncbi:hypothetical protein CDB3_25560 [Bacillus sp. CDB3]|nr:hypothetical protein CDB3_25560 [Bacillus sp. CDB3]